MSSYLDYNATTPIDSRVLMFMTEVYNNVIGNADSRTHDFGQNARQVVENARQEVASLLNVNKDEVFFTSGATESNNIAIQGLAEYGLKNNKTHIITTAIEHKSILNTFEIMKQKGFVVDIVYPESNGRILSEHVLNKVTNNTLLVSVMHVNNETGIIQPVDEIGKELKKKKILFHIDATQSCGKLVEEIRSLEYDMLSFSAHKFNGPQGVGALVLRKANYKYPPIQNVYGGGQQENSFRPGTLPVALIAGIGKTCLIAQNNYKSDHQLCAKIKNNIIEQLNNSGLKYEVNGDQRFCVDSTLNLSFNGINAEALMLAGKEYCSISNGSACTSKSYARSYVLEAMKLENDRIDSSVRLSWGRGSDCDEISVNFSKLIQKAKSLL